MPTIHALLVAIDQYPNPNHALNGCANDLRALQQYLETQAARMDRPLRCQTLLDEAATRQAVIEGFEAFQEAEPGDTCLFFYAGHGAQWASPEAFWHIEPDRYNESLVLYDSRTEGGRDLMDKELSYLIWKATHGREAHFVAITDCCHAGTITRLSDAAISPLRERRIEKMDTAIPLSEYLGAESYTGYEAYRQSGSGDVAPPRGDYIHLAAARANQTAKEVRTKGKARGVFSYFLESTLRSAAGQLSYAELLQRISIGVQQYARDQSPQLEATAAAHKNRAFLSGAALPEPGHLLLSYSRGHQWQVNAGALHQVTAAGPSPTQFELIEEGHTVTATQVRLDSCSVEGMEGYSRQQIYPVRMIPNHPPEVNLAFAPGNEIKGQELLDELLRLKPPKMYKIVEREEQVQYLIHCKSGHYYLTSPPSARALFKRIAGYRSANATTLLNQLETLSHWRQLLDLHNPDTKIRTEELRIELFAGTEAGNDQNEAPMRPLDWREAAHLPYQYDGAQWQGPTFQLKLTNTGQRRLWCSVLFLGDDFSVNNQLMPAQELAPGESAWAMEIYDGESYRTHRLQMDDSYLDWGITRIQDYFKVIISTQEFDTHRLNQEGLERERPAAPTRSFRSRNRVPSFDWAAKDIRLDISRPLPAMHLQPGQPAEQFGITLKLEEGGQAQARWATLEDAIAQMGPGFQMALPDGGFFRPAELGPVASQPGLCTLHLWDARFTDTGSLRLHTPFKPQRLDSLQAYLWTKPGHEPIALIADRSEPGTLSLALPPIKEGWIGFHQMPPKR